ncbi:uncharacterized protein LOC119066119 [Bradysia coprophila]|uniref:uncharacterized protein LOC119066119 n=1 Tax=Bradysia coprophila TaxID=38358 RepID=UPI00187D84FF|nr:uncharacterized protein LOC119066119 [Bradysia coprophila]
MIIMMNRKSILSVTILFVVCTSSPIVNGLLNTPRQIADKCDLTARPQCSSDCTKILACVSRVETPIMSVNCIGNTPYCDNGRCVTKPGKCTKTALETEFLCTSSGVFPDPKDCRKSHFCADVGSHSVMSLCPRGHIFDSKTKVCGRKSSNSESICQKISCDGATNDFVAFTANPTFYAYCFTSATGVHHTYMYKCDDEINKMFDVSIKKCRFNCKAIGYYADPMDCSSYYICNGLKFASRRVHCPPNYYFNGTVCLNSKAHCPIGSIVASSTVRPTSTVDSSMVDETFTTLKPTVLPDSSLPDDVIPTSTLIADSSLPDDVIPTSISIADSTLPDVPDELTSTLRPISGSSLADEISATNELTPSEEVVTDTTMSFSESSTTERSTTSKPTTVESVAFQMNLTTKKPSIWKHMGLISVRVGRLLNIV